MQKLSLVVFLCFLLLGYSYAQSASFGANKSNSYSSPPVAPSQTGNGVQSNNIAITLQDSGNKVRFLNGSFEANNGFYIVNGSNQTITNNVMDVTAFGCGDEIDLMSNSCGYGTALSGKYFLALSTHGGTCPDAFTMELNMSLVAGNTYTISYFDRGYDVNGCCAPSVPLEVGVSTSATAQGSVIYTSPQPTVNAWTKRTFSFVAPNNGRYISFKALANAGRWTHIDSLTISGAGSGNGCNGATCNKAVGLAATDLTTNSAQLNWSGANCVLGYHLEYRVKNVGKWQRVLVRQNKKMLTGLSPATTYQWRVLTICKVLPDSLMSNIFANGPEFTTSTVATLANRQSGLNSDKVNVATGLTVSILPNPAHSTATIKLSQMAGAVQVVLTDSKGNIVWQRANLMQNTVTIDMSHFAPGMYMVLVNSSKETKSVKLVKQ